MSEESKSRSYHVSVDFVTELDPDRIEEYVRANFKIDEESIKMTDLSGPGMSGKIALEEGPAVEDLVLEAMEDA